jgi:hypothetical protein
MAGISIPVSVALNLPIAIPVVALAAVVTAIVVWHLSRGRRITVRRTAKGNLIVIFDTAPRRATRRAR